mgnify:CR=1 FL=1
MGSSAIQSPQGPSFQERLASAVPANELVAAAPSKVRSAGRSITRGRTWRMYGGLVEAGPHTPVSLAVLVQISRPTP